MPLTNEILERFKKDDISTFVETGTFHGTGVKTALAVGFEKVLSIEAYPIRYNRCCSKFKGNDNVVLIMGDSSKDFHLLLEKLTTRAVFWLDAHAAQGAPEKECPDGHTAEVCPILSELKQIRNHHIKNHTILIDDRRTFPRDNVTEKDIIEELNKINSSYSIYNIDSSHFSSDIIVAEVL
jgi:hypothetical protein